MSKVKEHVQDLDKEYKENEFAALAMELVQHAKYSKNHFKDTLKQIKKLIQTDEDAKRFFGTVFRNVK